MSRIKIIILALIVLLILVLGWFCYQSLNVDTSSTKENTIILKFENLKEELFLRSKIWGVSGNHEEIVLSINQTGIVNHEIDYVFYSSEIYFQIINGCTLIIYAPESGISEPKIPFRDVKIIINGLRNYDDIRNYRINYQKYGLNKVSVYNQCTPNLTSPK
jgi:hypothetical protein